MSAEMAARRLADRIENGVIDVDGVLVVARDSIERSLEPIHAALGRHLRVPVEVMLWRPGDPEARLRDAVLRVTAPNELRDEPDGDVGG
jgi:hypothetical protein